MMSGGWPFNKLLLNLKNVDVKPDTKLAILITTGLFNIHHLYQKTFDHHPPILQER